MPVDTELRRAGIANEPLPCQSTQRMDGALPCPYAKTLIYRES